MNTKTLKAAKAEAKRFLDAVSAFEKAEAEKAEHYYSTPRQSGAVKRASMDLTRALADLRRAG